MKVASLVVVSCLIHLKKETGSYWNVVPVLYVTAEKVTINISDRIEIIPFSRIYLIQMERVFTINLFLCHIHEWCSFFAEKVFKNHYAWDFSLQNLHRIIQALLLKSCWFWIHSANTLWGEIQHQICVCWLWTASVLSQV